MTDLRKITKKERKKRINDKKGTLTWNERRRRTGKQGKEERVKRKTQ